MAMKLNNLSQHVVGVINELARNEGLIQLLINDVINPFDKDVDENVKKNIANPNSNSCRLFPYPFDPEATIADSSFIRVYYNQGEFDESQTIQEMSMHVDIIVAKSLWLINDHNRKQRLIRPYEIMDRVVDMVGRRSVSPIKLNFTGWQHLSVNTKFDCIRLYSDYFSVEAENYYG